MIQKSTFLWPALIVAVVGCEAGESSPRMDASSSPSEVADATIQQSVSCEQTDLDFSQRVGQIASEHSTCSIDYDCVIVDALLTCSSLPIILGTCGGALAKAERDEFDASVQGALAVEFCIEERTPCTATGGCPAMVAKCTGGTCVATIGGSED